MRSNKLYVAASLFVASSIFGQTNDSYEPPKECRPCPQPEPPTQICPAKPPVCCPPWTTPVLNAAYNYPSRIKTRCPMDIWFDASFIYWSASEDSLELGVDSRMALFNPGTGTVITDLTASAIKMDFGWSPGFKVGGGINFNHDNWDTQAEYTWFHASKQHASATAGPDSPVLLHNIVAPRGMPIVSHSALPFTQGSFETADGLWTIHSDFVDWNLGRWYYVGTKLNFRPFVGVRGAWIRQRYQSTYSTPTIAVTNGDTMHVVEKSHSWAVGPEAGIDTNWAFWSSFRFYGNAMFDILYTRYTHLSTNQTHDNPTGMAPHTYLSENNLGVLRTHLDLELGFGWGTYFNCNNWYLDFTLGYGFQVFFNQNMFRHFNGNPVLLGADNTSQLYNNEFVNGNLYFQGLTFNARLDF